MYKEAVEKEIVMMLKERIIEAANREWASPIMIIRKKDDTIRLCVDYHKLNVMTQIDAYPMPWIDDILDQVGQARYITTLDLAKGYWQVLVAEVDRPKTVFILHEQWMIDQVIRGMHMHKFASAYLDDLIVFSSTWKDHLHI